MKLETLRFIFVSFFRFCFLYSILKQRRPNGRAAVNSSVQYSGERLLRAIQRRLNYTARRLRPREDRCWRRSQKGLSLEGLREKEETTRARGLSVIKRVRRVLCSRWHGPRQVIPCASLAGRTEEEEPGRASERTLRPEKFARLHSRNSIYLSLWLFLYGLRTIESQMGLC